MGDDVQGKNEILSQIGHGLRFSKYELAQYDEDVLVAFLEDGQAIFAEIPKEMVTDKIRLIAVEFDVTGMVMSYINPDDTLIYRDLSISSMESNYGNLKYVNSAWVDMAFMNSALERKPEAIFPFFEHYQELVHAAFDQTSLETFLSKNEDALRTTLYYFVCDKFTTHLISDDFLQKHLMNIANLGSRVFKSNKQHLIVAGIKNGGWPESLLAYKPTDLAHAVKLSMKATSSMLLDWHKAYIKTHDMKEVINIMKTPARKEMLESIYSRAELMPHMTKNQAIKGRWLSDDLGL